MRYEPAVCTPVLSVRVVEPVLLRFGRPSVTVGLTCSPPLAFEAKVRLVELLLGRFGIPSVTVGFTWAPPLAFETDAKILGVTPKKYGRSLQEK